jgi:hypothetical protein
MLGRPQASEEASNPSHTARGPLEASPAPVHCASLPHLPQMLHPPMPRAQPGELARLEGARWHLAPRSPRGSCHRRVPARTGLTPAAHASGGRRGCFCHAHAYYVVCNLSPVPLCEEDVLGQARGGGGYKCDRGRTVNGSWDPSELFHARFGRRLVARAPMAQHASRALPRRWHVLWDATGWLHCKVRAPRQSVCDPCCACSCTF